MKRLVLLGLLLLLGCPRTVTVVCTWTSNGNPGKPVCGSAASSNCLLNYVLYNQTTGAVIATIPITATSYTFTASTQGVSANTKLGLVVNEQTANGIISSPKAVTTVVQ